MKLKVLLTSNIPSPYFVNYANELNKYVDLTVAFELHQAKDREKSWYKNNFKFNAIFLDGLKIGNESGLSFKIKKIIKNGNFDRIIIANPMTLTGIIAIKYCKRHKIDFILQSEGGFQGSGKGLKERFKKNLMSNAKMYLTGMGGDDDYFLKYGASKNTLKPYYFTSSFASEIDREICSTFQREELKKLLGIKTKYFILYVGQFIYRKGIDQLLKIFKGVDDECTLVCIGGTPTDEYKQIINELEIKNVEFINFIDKEKLADYYKAADTFIMLTREDTWGLVVNEAMEHGSPVIVSDLAIAGRYLIKDYENGFLVKFDAIDETRNKLKLLLKDEKLNNQIRLNNLNKIKDHNLENMALQIFNYIK